MYLQAPSVPFGAIIQVPLAVVAYKLADREILWRNGFTSAPIKEVAFLFVGIFATMAPALGFLEQNAPTFGVETPTAFYFSTGLLSAVLDNAPTYLSMLQTNFGLLGLRLDVAQMPSFLQGSFVLHAGTAAETIISGERYLATISQAAVFFGAMTYIGNGPNFMVKAIAEASGVKMPSFFGYLLYSCAALLGILVLNWLLFVR
jgi:Na+/H+ antiporter NhaD/arsenite permease-like protein